MTIGNLLILERAPNRADVVERFRVASEYASWLRQRLGVPTFLRRRARWDLDPDFDPGRHVRTLTVPSPGDMRQVLDVVGLLEPVPFEPDTPPWDAMVIDGLTGGKAALFLRTHPVITDGFGGASIVGLLLDECKPSSGGRANAVSNPEGTKSTPGNGRRPVTITIDLTGSVRPLASGVSTILNAEPTGIVIRGVQRGLDVANSASRQVLLTGEPLGPWSGTRSTSSHFEILSVPGARAVALELGGSRNTLLVAAAAGGIGLYLKRLAQPCPELRLATPARLRHSSEVGESWFAPILIGVPTSVGHPGPQFGVVAERLARARSEPVLRLTRVVAAAIGRLPTRLLIPALHAQADTVDFAATTLPGSRVARQLCGAAVEQSYQFGPRLGCPVNITAVGNEDRLDIGMTLDPAVFIEPDVLVDCLRTSFSGFGAAAEPGPMISPKRRTQQCCHSIASPSA